MATKKKCVSIYLEYENFLKLKKVAKMKEQTTSRWLSQYVVKLVDKLLKKEGVR